VVALFPEQDMSQLPAFPPKSRSHPERDREMPVFSHGAAAEFARPWAVSLLRWRGFRALVPVDLTATRCPFGPKLPRSTSRSFIQSRYRVGGSAGGVAHPGAGLGPVVWEDNLGEFEAGSC